MDTWPPMEGSPSNWGPLIMLLGMALVAVVIAWML